MKTYFSPKNFPHYVSKAQHSIQDVIRTTPLQINEILSQEYQANIFLKREDMQAVRSYKIRGAYFMISNLSEVERNYGVVCASAGNHAQGVAFSCHNLGIKWEIFMPKTTPNQKIRATKMFGQSHVKIHTVGDSFDECSAAAQTFAKEKWMVFIPPFDHQDIITGQATVGKEIFDALPETETVIIPHGWWGLASGVSTYLKSQNPSITCIGVEPAGIASYSAACQNKKPLALSSGNKFVDGAAVLRSGDLTFELCQKHLDHILPVSEWAVAQAMLWYHNRLGSVVEPAGALSVAALDSVRQEIIGKNVVCIVSGGNFDPSRRAEVELRALLHEWLRHYIQITFAQRAWALKEFTKILWDKGDIVHFEYDKSSVVAKVTIDVTEKTDFIKIRTRLEQTGITYEYLNENENFIASLLQRDF